MDVTMNRAETVIKLGADLGALQAKLSAKTEEFVNSAVDGDYQRCDVLRNECHELVDMYLDKRANGVAHIARQFGENNDQA